ncbi:hypothetical protein [Nocardia vulneris]|uniref:Uncharacterized protein n=1 Tax=Nocardia vulneris TaxID=1141657 RepID=A0ABR4ZCK2_9NOCA|nr:hypothetical protein [Nocardia vulneris]KIA63045.1 hypothetical protein FG87_22060 [Nocardia vulneris]
MSAIPEAAIPEAAVAFVADLLRTPAESMEHRVGRWVWEILGDGSRDQVMESVTAVMANNPPQSRTFEVAYDIWLLLGGRGAAA